MGEQDTHYISEEKKKALEAELDELRTVKRKEIADALEYARSLGDLSENAEYLEAREAQARLEDRIRQIKEILKNVTIISEHHADAVELGSVVVVNKKGSSEDQEFHIVGSSEADVLSGKISNESPIGSALMGKKKGDSVDVETLRGKVTYKIVKIK